MKTFFVTTFFTLFLVIFSPLILSLFTSQISGFVKLPVNQVSTTFEVIKKEISEGILPQNSKSENLKTQNKQTLSSSTQESPAQQNINSNTNPVQFNSAQSSSNQVNNSQQISDKDSLVIQKPFKEDQRGNSEVYNSKKKSINFSDPKILALIYQAFFLLLLTAVFAPIWEEFAFRLMLGKNPHFNPLGRFFKLTARTDTRTDTKINPELNPDLNTESNTKSKTKNIITNNLKEQVYNFENNCENNFESNNQETAQEIFKKNQSYKQQLQTNKLQNSLIQSEMFYKIGIFSFLVFLGKIVFDLSMFSINPSNQNSFLTVNNLAWFGYLVALVFVVFYFLDTRDWDYFRNWHAKNQFLVYFVTVIIFALIHTFNHSFETFHPIYLLLNLPQFFAGLTFGFFRVRYGFGWAVWSHCLHNFSLIMIFLVFG
jgi:hypothetical protein